MTPTQPSQAVPKLPSHPEPHSMTWSRLELETIEEYGVRCFEAGRAELARPQEVVAVDEVDFVDYIHPEFGPGYFCTPDVFDDLFASQRVPVALPAERPINCGTGHCSCIECLYQPKQGDAKDARPNSFHSDSGECDRVQAPGHHWDRTGERCLICGDKDWMGGECSGPSVEKVLHLQKVNGELQAQYNELIYAVANKHPGESRHQTALKYIQRAETSSSLASQVSNAAILAGKPTVGEGK